MLEGEGRGVGNRRQYQEAKVFLSLRVTCMAQPRRCRHGCRTCRAPRSWERLSWTASLSGNSEKCKWSVTYGTRVTLGTPGNFQWHAEASCFRYRFCYDSHRKYIDLDLYKFTNVVGTLNDLRPLKVGAQLAKCCRPLGSRALMSRSTSTLLADATAVFGSEMTTECPPFSEVVVNKQNKNNEFLWCKWKYDCLSEHSGNSTTTNQRARSFHFSEITRC